MIRWLNALPKLGNLKPVKELEKLETLVNEFEGWLKVLLSLLPSIGSSRRTKRIRRTIELEQRINHTELLNKPTLTWLKKMCEIAKGKLSFLYSKEIEACEDS